MHVSYFHVLWLFSHALCVLPDYVLIHAYSSSNDVGAFECSNLSSISILSGASVDIASATINLLCNVTGGGDLSLACRPEDCEMSFGGEINHYSNTSAYHVSNAEFARLQTSGAVTFGSHSDRNVSNMLLDEVSATFSASNVSFFSSSGYIRILNGSSTFALSAMGASIVLGAVGNVSIETDVMIDLINGGTSAFKTSGMFIASGSMRLFSFHSIEFHVTLCCSISWLLNTKKCEFRHMG